ncbi:MAG: hypothetical protein IPN38_04090 [Flavobacteriales bacterium]|nr:hypothetical protein [Flavobacteriales bacterium]
MELEAGDLAAAIADGRRAMRVSSEGGNLEGQVGASDLLRRAYKAMGHADSAYHYFELRVMYADSLINATNLNKLQNMALAQELKEQEDAKLKSEEVAARSQQPVRHHRPHRDHLGIFPARVQSHGWSAPRPSRTYHSSRCCSSSSSSTCCCILSWIASRTTHRS